MEDKKEKGFTLVELLLVTALISLFGSTIMLTFQTIKRQAETQRAHLQMRQLVYKIEIERLDEDKVLKEITGSNCSQCPCETEDDLKDPGTTCQNSMQNALDAIKARMIEDPWGNFTYFIKEGELVGGEDDCTKDEIRSAGPDRQLQTSDDLYMEVPLFSNQCTN